MGKIRMATAADTKAILDIYAPYIEHTNVCLLYTSIPCGEENGQQKHKNNCRENNCKKSEYDKKYKICTQAGNYLYAGKQRTFW